MYGKPLTNKLEGSAVRRKSDGGEIGASTKPMEGMSGRIGYVPALDGVRAAAILLVLIAHYDVTGGWLGGCGEVGVDLFFVLSGYLITSIILSEWNETGRVRLRAFYWRRILRIWPAFLVLLAVYCAAIRVASSHVSDHFQAALAAALSFMNWVQALWDGPQGYVGHAWSLSIEEQFYLIWPALLILVVSRIGQKALVPTLLVILFVGIVWRLYLAATGVPAIRLYAGTDTHADPILFGCILASLSASWPFREKFAGMQVGAWVFLGVIALIPAWSVRWFAWEFTATGVLGTLIIIAAKGPDGFEILSSKPAI